MPDPADDRSLQGWARIIERAGAQPATVTTTPATVAPAVRTAAPAKGKELLRGHPDLYSLIEDPESSLSECVTAWQHYMEHWHGSLTWLLVDRLARERTD